MGTLSIDLRDLDKLADALIDSSVRTRLYILPELQRLPTAMLAKYTLRISSERPTYLRR